MPASLSISMLGILNLVRVRVRVRVRVGVRVRVRVGLGFGLELHLEPDRLVRLGGEEKVLGRGRVRVRVGG